MVRRPLMNNLGTLNSDEPHIDMGIVTRSAPRNSLLQRHFETAVTPLRRSTHSVVRHFSRQVGRRIGIFTETFYIPRHECELEDTARTGHTFSDGLLKSACRSRDTPQERASLAPA